MSEAVISDEFFAEDVLEEIFAVATKQDELFSDNIPEREKRVLEVL